MVPGHTARSPGLAVPAARFRPRRKTVSQIDDTPEEDEPHWTETESPDQWVETAHDRVFGRNGSDAQHATHDAVYEFADGFPDWTIVVTGGPYRSHDVKYRTQDPSDIIHLDFYSVRPGYGRLDEVADDVRAYLQLPEGKDAAGREPFAVGGFEWELIDGSEIEQGHYVPQTDGDVLYVKGTQTVEVNGDDIVVAPLYFKIVQNNLMGRTDIFNDTDIHLEFQTAADAAEFATAQLFQPDSEYWVLTPVDDESGDD